MTSKTKVARLTESRIRDIIRQEISADKARVRRLIREEIAAAEEAKLLAEEQQREASAAKAKAVAERLRARGRMSMPEFIEERGFRTVVVSADFRQAEFAKVLDQVRRDAAFAARMRDLRKDETPPAQTETPPAQTETPPAQTETPPAQTETPHVSFLARLFARFR